MRQAFQLDRRAWLRAAVCLAATTAYPRAWARGPELGGPLAAWSEGVFDIHHIDTGRGNSTLLVFPDGTTMLIDAGAATEAVAGTMAAPRPSAAMTPGDAIAAYLKRHAPAGRLDYFLATHVHPDHVSGVMDVARQTTIVTCIDRGFPVYPAGKEPATSDWAEAYGEFLRERVRQGEAVEAAKVGSTKQVGLRRGPEEAFDFVTRVLAANGDVWNPATKRVDAFAGKLGASQENVYSTALHFRYGAFRYYTGGDLTFDTRDGSEPALDVESAVARAAGRVEVAVANHHGYFDACGPAFANVLDAQAYVIPSWDIGHPGSAQMQRLLGAWEGKATHDVFALELLPANALMNRRFAPLLKSKQGHVVVRVERGGKSYSIYTLDSTDENGAITGVFGPYRSRA